MLDLSLYDAFFYAFSISSRFVKKTKDNLEETHLLLVQKKQDFIVDAEGECQVLY